MERRDAKKEKENLAASLKRKLLEAASSVPEPVEKVVLKKRKTGRWSKGWAYVDPEMEATRLKEDAMEAGRDIDARALERLKEDVVKREDSTKAPANLGRGSRAAGLAARAKIVERAASVRSALSRRKTEKGEKRKSMLGRAASLLKPTPAVVSESIENPFEVDESVISVSHEGDSTIISVGRFSFEEEPEILVASTHEEAPKTLRQSTLAFPPISTVKKEKPAPPADLAEDVDVLEMVLGSTGPARVSAV